MFQQKRREHETADMNYIRQNMEFHSKRLNGKFAKNELAVEKIISDSQLKSTNI